MSRELRKTSVLLESVDGYGYQPISQTLDEIQAGRDLWSRGFLWRVIRGFMERRVSDQEYHYLDRSGQLRVMLVVENQIAPAPARAGAAQRQRNLQRVSR